MKQIAGFALFSHLSFCWRINQRVCIALLVCAATAVNSRAQTFTTLANFEGLNGSRPLGPLVQGADGDIYGTTSAGGANDLGTIFKATPDGALTTLYSFGSTPTDGAVPYGGLVQGSDGNFYGTTSESGANSNQVFAGGTVFKITPGGALTTLHSFNVSDGAYPVASLVQGSDGNFYGTTEQGGASGNNGTVFKITAGGTLTMLHNFCEDGCLDGAAPSGPLIQAPDGNFYGTTSQAGAHGYGTVFKITPEGALTTLYSFGSSTSFLPGGLASQGFNPIDGGNPNAGLILAADGNIYGTTPLGGTGGVDVGGDRAGGTVFKITLGGTLTTLYNFCSQAGCPDGAGPTGPLIQAPDGNFYGTTAFGGSGGALGSGTVFRITPGGTLTTLYTFNSPGGSLPNAGLLQATDGNFYGTTLLGGANGDGTLIRLHLPAPAGYACTNTTPPVVTSIDSAAGYGGYSYFASGSWLEIKGTNLADPSDPRLTASTNPGQWTWSDFKGGNAPTILDGISVSINGMPAYVWYLSPTQLNVQAPEDFATGNVAITVTNCKATSSPFMLPRRPLAPGLLAPSNYSAGGTQYMLATFASDGAYVLNTSTGAAFGLNSRPAKPGDVIIAYGIGFGDVTPSILPGVIVQQSNTLANPVIFAFGSMNATLAYSGLAGGYVGLYEFFITVPSGLADGDYQINVTQNGVKVPQTMYLTVHN